MIAAQQHRINQPEIVYRKAVAPDPRHMQNLAALIERRPVESASRLQARHHARNGGLRENRKNIVGAG